MKNVWRRSSALLTAAAMTAAFIPTTVTAQDTAVTSDGYTVTTNDYSDGIPYQSQIAMYDASGKIEPIGTDVSYGSAAYNTDIASLKNTIAASNGVYTQYASKSGEFASDDDAQNGIAQLTFDAVGKQDEVTPYDVVLVLDESGSMNMLSSNLSATNISPDLDPDHYYCIPASAGFGNTSDIFFQLNTIGDGTIAFRPWYLYEGDVWQALQDKYPELNSDLFNSAFNSHKGFLNAINAWNPGQQLYYLDNNEYKPIKLTTTNSYDSPADGNAYGCYDRMTIEKDSAKSLVSTIANTDADARVAVIGFNGTATTRCGLTETKDNEAGLTEINKALDNKVGNNDTNYTNALNAASKILSDRSKDNTSDRPAYVVFITDGNPWSGLNTYADAATALKEQATVYAVGINSGALTALSTVASEPAATYAVDCASADDFSQKINSIAQTISNSSVLTDTIGDGYSLLIDAQHPMTLNGVQYTSMPDSVWYDAANNQVKWNVADGTLENGECLQFYVQLDPTLRTVSSVSNSYPTNGTASLDYSSRTSTGETKGNSVPLYSPSVKYDISTFPSSLISDQMTNNDPAVLGKEVTDGDTVTYTMTVTNTGTVNAKSIALKNYVPLNTTFNKVVTGNGIYSAGTNSIAWTIDELAAGQSASVSFSVKLNQGIKASAPIEMIDDTFTWGWGTAADYGTADPQCVGNMVENPTPAAPAPELPVTPATPVTPSTPVTPVTPATPAAPVEPASPVTPVTPAEPETPVTTAEETPAKVEERPSTPNTGDQTNAETAAWLMLGSLFTAAVLFRYKKKYSD